jgi:hypothetical protein
MGRIIPYLMENKKKMCETTNQYIYSIYICTLFIYWSIYIYLCIYSLICVFTYSPVSKDLCVWFVYLWMCMNFMILSACLCVRVSFIYISMYLVAYLILYLSIYLFTHLCLVCLSIYLFFYLSNYSLMH